MKPATLVTILLRATAIIGLGLFLLLTNFHPKAFPMMTYWPVALVIVGVWAIASSKESRLWGVLLLITGIALYLTNQNLITLTVVVLYWPTVLIAVGTFTLVRSWISWIAWKRKIAAGVLYAREKQNPKTLFS